MRHLIAVIIATFILESAIARSEDTASEEFAFSVESPKTAGWKLVKNGIVGNRNRSHFVLLTNADDQRTVSLLAAPLPKKVFKSDEGGRQIRTLDEFKDGFEKGFFKAADEKVSSEKCKLSGLDAYRYVALKKLPNGEVRHVVAILAVHEGKSYAISTMVREPWGARQRPNRLY